MSKYDNLDPRKELEQIVYGDLKRGLEKRGFEIMHNGTPTMNAPANKSDIEINDDNYRICVEVTKRRKSTQDGEYQSIKDHLIRAKRENPRKKCFLIFISPETYYRTFSSIRDSNIVNSDKSDLKIIPLSFVNFELFITKLIQNPKEDFPKRDILSLFDKTEEYIDDEAILKLLSNTLFYEDTELKKEISIKEEERHQQTVQDLIKDLKKFEDDLRKNGIATHTDAIKNVIYLVFMKLYEEKREYEKKTNRFSRMGFIKFQDVEDNQKTACHKLFELIKNDHEIKIAKMFNEHDLLAEKFTDEFVMNYFVIPFEKYFFYTTKVDGLGAAYEVLGQLSGKDTKAGQFFTPENVVRFMIKLADLKSDDIVLDPACGTGRFLIYAMYDMLSKINGRNREEKEKKIKQEQLFGSDFDSYVSKLSKMNMYIHGDGKTNVQDKDGLLLPDKDNKIDVILTNPPLGNLSYNLPSYNDNFKINRMVVIPRKNLTEGKILSCRKALENSVSEERKEQLRQKINELQNLLQTDPEIVITGNEIKGGALFINASNHYLKNDSNDDMPIEWRGGKLVIIVDEGLLNTDDYSKLREFIKRNFYIKAVISLTSDTFIPVSKTPNKTSILFAIKKSDTDAVQKEPIFFSYVDKVGLNTKRKVCENHLFNGTNVNTVIENYNEFRKLVLSCYSGKTFDERTFISKIKNGKRIDIQRESFFFARKFDEIEDRLDIRFYDPKFDEIKQFMKSNRVMHLREVVLPDGMDYGLTASGQERGKIPFVNIENLTKDGLIDDANIRFVNEVSDNLLLSKGELLISRSRLIGLASITTEKEVKWTYGSYIIRFKLDMSKVEPLFVAKFINSKKGMLQTELLKTGSVGENINSEQLLRVTIPKIDKIKQLEILRKIKDVEDKAEEIEKKVFLEREKAKNVIEDEL